MNKQYLNPPIIEALCEFKFSNDTQWDMAVPGLLYQELKSEFPIREERKFNVMDFSQTDSTEMPPKIISNELMVFLKENRKLLIQVGRNLLTINCLKPYQNWNNFRYNIELAYNSLSKIVNLKKLQRIDLRYINQIEIEKKFPEQPLQLEKYFCFYPFRGNKMPDGISSFMVGCVFLFHSSRDACKVEFKDKAVKEQNKYVFMLDLDYYLAQPQNHRIEDTLQWIEEAHQKIIEIFEACITDELRKFLRGIG